MNENSPNSLSYNMAIDHVISFPFQVSEVVILLAPAYPVFALQSLKVNKPKGVSHDQVAAVSAFVRKMYCMCNTQYGAPMKLMLFKNCGKHSNVVIIVISLFV